MREVKRGNSKRMREMRDLQGLVRSSKFCEFVNLLICDLSCKEASV